MSALTAIARAQALTAGTAQPLCTVRHLHVSARPLVLVPLTLAGETNAPLAAMIGDDRRRPHVVITSRPRLRAQRLVFAEQLAAVLVHYLTAYSVRREPVRDRKGEARTRVVDAPQVWVPNPGGIDFVRLTGRMTRFRQVDGPWAVTPAVPVLGRWATWLAEQAEFADSSVLVAATRALSSVWATGQSSIEDGNLAALMAWISPPAGMSAVAAALRAEDPTMCPPAGPATDPLFDRWVLAPELMAYEAATSDAHRAAINARLQTALAGQLQPTWDLMWQAIDVLRAMPAGAHVPGRWDQDKDAFTRQVDNLREGYRPPSKRDGAVKSAKRLHDMERRQAVLDAQRAFDDPLVMAEYRLGGEAFVGTVTAVEADRVTKPSTRRVLRPLITVRTADPVRLVPGDHHLHDRQRPAQHAEILDMEHDGHCWTVTLELSGGMGGGLTAPPGSVPAVGDTVTYSKLKVSFTPAGKFPDRDDTPWTHGGPPPVYTPTLEDAAEDWS